MNSFLIAMMAMSAVQSWAAELKRLPAPDDRYIATVGTTKSGESEVTIFASHGFAKFKKSFASEDGEHGRVILQAEWTKDSRFFVIISESSGGHSPLMHPIQFWDRNDNKLRMLDCVVGGITGGFTLDAPDIVHGKRIAAPDSTNADDQDDFSISLSSAARYYRQPNHSIVRPTPRKP